MGRGNGKSGKPGGGEADAEGPVLWKTYTRDIVPLPGKKIADNAPAAKKTSIKTRERSSVSAPAAAPLKPVAEKQAPQLDARTDQRLRRGQLPIDGTLDLHGMTQAEAHERLEGFVQRAYARKKRCLLIITGKGRSGPGVLRQKLPQWLSLPPLQGMVLKIYPAAAEHGGSGAWYVYLKRQRDY